jgi:hypothetical protein
MVLTAVALGLLACSQREVHLRVEVSLAEEGPLTGVRVTALPFDPDRILDSLESASSAPRPQFPELQAEMAAYRRPDLDALQGVGAAWLATRDSVAHLADSLNQVSPASPGYAAAYERLRRSYQNLAQRAVERDRELRERVGDDRDLASRAAAAADSLRRWEQRTFAAFAELSQAALVASGDSATRVTDDDGVAEFSLTTGSWWLLAVWTSPENPFREHHWNVPVRLSVVGPTLVPLYTRNAVERWRH